MKKITLKEALRARKVKKGDYIDYQPISATCTLGEEETGYEEEQTFSTESLRWRLDKFEGKLILVADDATKQELTLRGKKGYYNGVEAQNELCAKLYSNPSISSKVLSITEEIQYSIANCNIIRGPYWLDSRLSNGVHFIVRYWLVDDVYNKCLWLKYGITDSPAYAVRPVVFLQSNIKINLEQGDGSKENPWGIYEEES